MTPLQVIILVHKTRQAQKRYFAYRDNLQECKRLEALLDDAIVPYLNHYNALPSKEKEDV